MKKALIALLVMAVALSLTAVAVSAAQVNPPYGYTTNENGIMAYAYNSNGHFDLMGFYAGDWKQTTYANRGYYTYLSQNDTTKDVDAVSTQNGGYDVNDLNVAIDLAFTNEGKTLQITYTVKNNGTQDQTFSLGSSADVQIGHDDSAIITPFDDGSGFKMVSDDSDDMAANGEYAQFNFFGIGYNGVTDVSDFWYGTYSSWSYDIAGHTFYGQQEIQITTSDSAAAWHWADQTVPAGQSKVFSLLIGIGGAGSENAAAGVTVNGYNGAFDGSGHGIEVIAPDGAVVKFGTSAGVYDLDTTPSFTMPGTYTVYYQVTVPNAAPVTGSVTVTIDPIPLTFSATVNDKIEDGTTAATVSGVTINGLLNGEALEEGVDYEVVSAAFDDALVGNNKNVTVVINLLNTEKTNKYALASRSAVTTASILPADAEAPVVTLENGKVYCLTAAFTVTDEHDFTVTLNGQEITAVNGVYTLPANGEQTIVAEDVYGNKTEMTVTVNAEHTYGPYYLQGAPLCMRDMMKVATCEYCGAEDYKVAYGTAMEHVTHIECDEDGHWEACSRCFADFAKESHVEGEWIIDKAATETEKGQKHTECTVCGYVIRTEEIPVVFNCEHEETSLSGAKDATCTEKGYTGDLVCDACGQTVTEGEDIPALGHDVDEWVITEDSHWLVCKADDQIVEGSNGAHADTDYNGKCDLCSYQMNAAPEIDEPGASDDAPASFSPVAALLISILGASVFLLRKKAN